MEAHTHNFREVVEFIFRSLPRADQRRRAEEYLHGLMCTDGRKSARRMSEVVGGRAADQSLQHFISNSPWDWEPVRKAYTTCYVRRAKPLGLVVQPYVIPKSGRYSVGVERRFDAGSGKLVNAQRAAGVWVVSARAESPIDWRLHLPSDWVQDSERRKQAAIPAHIRQATLEERVLETLREVPCESIPADVPAVLDCRELSIASVLDLQRSARPFVARVAPSTILRIADPALVGHCPGQTMPALRIVNSARTTPRLVKPVLNGPPEYTWTVSVRVRVPVRDSGSVPRQATQAMYLFAAGAPETKAPTICALSDSCDLSTEELLENCLYVERVDRTARSMETSSGLGDFSGRSYGGWHRHVTLATAAHGIKLLNSI